MRQCEDCHNWKADGFASLTGECRVFSPDVGDANEKKWPTTRCDDWCGQFQEKPQPVTKKLSWWETDTSKALIFPLPF